MCPLQQECWRDRLQTLIGNIWWQLKNRQKSRDFASTSEVTINGCESNRPVQHRNRTMAQAVCIMIGMYCIRTAITAKYAHNIKHG